MKKWMCLVLAGVLALCCTACDRDPVSSLDFSADVYTSIITNTSNLANTPAYESLLENLKSNQSHLYYYTKDINGNGVADLLILENTKLSVYTYEKSVKLIGEQDFLTGTVRFFSSDNINYPGIFYYTVGGGVDHYGYMTIKDKKLSFENLWEENYATEPQDSINRIKELSLNKDLISESKKLYNKNADIKFVSLKQ